MVSVIRIYEKCKKCSASLKEMNRHGTFPSKRTKSGIYFEKWLQCSNPCCNALFMAEADKRFQPEHKRQGALFAGQWDHKVDHERLAMFPNSLNAIADGIEEALFATFDVPNEGREFPYKYKRSPNLEWAPVRGPEIMPWD